MAADFQATLLPPTATPRMLALSGAMKFGDDLWAAALRAGDVKADLPDPALPFLIWELGLDEAAAWVSDPRLLLREGRAWQAIRGTPAAIAQALAWIEAPLAAIEEDPAGSWWDLYQLEVAGTPSVETLAAIIALARLSQPAHVDLIRIYGGHDERPVAADESMVGGPGLIDDWSGVWLRDGWPKISLGARLASGDALPPPAWRDGATEIMGARESVATAASLPGSEREIRGEAVPLEWGGGGWPAGPWPEGGWAEIFAPRPPFRFRGQLTETPA